MVNVISEVKNEPCKPALDKTIGTNKLEVTGTTDPAPAWVTVKVCSAMLKVPVLAVVLGLAETRK